MESWTHIDKEGDQSDRVSTLLQWNKDGEREWLLELQKCKSLESDCSNLETYSVTSRKPMQIRINRRDAAKMNDFLVTTRASVF